MLPLVSLALADILAYKWEMPLLATFLAIGVTEHDEQHLISLVPISILWAIVPGHWPLLVWADR